MSHRRRIGLSITNSSLIFDKQPSTWSHSTFLEPLKDCTHWKMKKTMQKLENLKTIRRRWSQLEVKLFTEKLKKKWRNWINSSKHSTASIIFSLLSSIAAFSAFHRSKEEKRQVLTNEEKQFSLETFFTRPHICNWSWYRIFSPPPAPVHRTTFLG